MNQCRLFTSEGYKGVSVIATILGGVHYYENYFCIWNASCFQHSRAHPLASEVARERQFSFRITEKCKSPYPLQSW